MNWSDQAMIISSKSFGENSAIVQALTFEHGLQSGIVRNFKTAKQNSTYVIGNIVEINWYARLADHLGSFKAELKEAIAAFVMMDRARLVALSSICAMLNYVLLERVSEKHIFLLLMDFFRRLKSGDYWQKSYINLELELLAVLGYGLDLQKCAVSGKTDRLIYVSPKTGRAIAEAAVGEYADRMLKLPQFLLDQDSIDPTAQEMLECLNLTAYFFTKHHSIANHNLPQIRLQLVEITKQGVTHG